MSDWETGRLFYLIALLALVASWFLYGQRQRLSTTIQQLLIWLGIFVLLIIGYGFRDTLTGELFPSAARQVSAETIAVNRSINGSFEATAEVNGVSVLFLVDTGASQVVLSQADARRVGFDPSALEFSGAASTANGLVRTAPISLDTLSFGGFTNRDVPATVNGGELDVSLLGMSYLGLFDSIEIRDNTLFLTRR